LILRTTKDYKRGLLKTLWELEAETLAENILENEKYYH
jgi:hypothetical protein